MNQLRNSPALLRLRPSNLEKGTVARSTPRLLALAIVLGALLTACATTQPDARVPDIVSVTLLLATPEPAGSGVGIAAVPGDAHAAEIEVYLGTMDGRVLVRTLPIALADAEATVQLLAGETYDFEFSVTALDGTEVAFTSAREIATPDLVVRLQPRSIISSIRLGDAYYDGAFLIAPIEVLTPAGGVAVHTDYALNVTVTNGSVTATSPLGVEIVPNDPSTAVLLEVVATGLLPSRLEGSITGSLTVTPSAVTPGEGALQMDLVPPVALIHSKPTSMRVGYFANISLRATDDRELARVTLYENMVPVYSSNGTFTSHSWTYVFQPTTARTYSWVLVVEDAAGNVGMDTHRFVVD